VGFQNISSGPLIVEEVIRQSNWTNSFMDVTPHSDSSDQAEPAELAIWQ